MTPIQKLWENEAKMRRAMLPTESQKYSFRKNRIVHSSLNRSKAAIGSDFPPKPLCIEL